MGSNNGRLIDTNKSIEHKKFVMIKDGRIFRLRKDGVTNQILEERVEDLRQIYLLGFVP
jgi:hypothetical protein